MSGPIKFVDPNDKLGSESSQKSSKSGAIPGFKEILEGDNDGRKSIAQLKKHNKSWDDSEDLDDFGKVKEDNVSLFDLSASNRSQKTQVKKEERDPRQQKEQEKEERSEVAMTSVDREEPIKPREDRLTRSEKPIMSKAQPKIANKQDLGEENDSEKEDKFAPAKAKPSQIVKAEEVLPPVLMSAASAAISQTKVEPPAVPMPQSPIQEIVDRIIDYISEMRFQGKTETIVTLKHPPLFSGAQLVLTSFDSAKGELNIAFENLTPKAKTFLDTGNKLEDLRTNLEQKGFVAHIITTTTEIETKTFVQANPFARGEREEQQQQQSRQQQQEEEEEQT